MQTIVITSGMGGAGKSLVCAGLGLGLSNLGVRVAVLETGRRTLDVLLGVEPVYDMGDVLGGEISLVQSALTVNPNLLAVAGTVGAAQTDLFFGDDYLRDCKRVLIESQTEVAVWEVSGGNTHLLESLCPLSDATLLVCAPDAVAARENRRLSDFVYGLGVQTPGLYVTPLHPQFVRQRPIPDLDWLVDQVCGQLWGILPYSHELLTPGEMSHKMKRFKQIGQPFDNLAQRVMGKYIDLWIS